MNRRAGGRRVRSGFRPERTRIARADSPKTKRHPRVAFCLHGGGQGERRKRRLWQALFYYFCMDAHKKVVSCQPAGFG